MLVSPKRNEAHCSKNSRRQLIMGTVSCTGTGSAGLLLNKSVSDTEDKLRAAGIESRRDFHAIVDRHFQCR